LPEQLGDNGRSTRRGDDDQKGIGGRDGAIPDLQTGAIQLTRHVTARAVENSGLWAESGAVGRGERATQSRAVENPDDMVNR
jgi:hypothetical protein